MVILKLYTLVEEESRKILATVIHRDNDNVIVLWEGEHQSIVIWPTMWEFREISEEPFFGRKKRRLILPDRIVTEHDDEIKLEIPKDLLFTNSYQGK